MSEEITMLTEWVDLFHGFGSWQPIIAAAAILLFFILARGIFARLLFSIFLGLTHKTKTEMDNNILLAFRKPLKALILLIGVYFALLVLPLPAQYYLVLKPIYRSLLVFFVAQGFYNLADCKNFMELSDRFGVDPTLLNFFSKVLKVLIVIFAVLIIAQVWGYNVGGFLAGLGLGGLAFALAAQDTAANVFGGIMIILDKPFSVGDWIYTPSVEGTVEEISFRSTKVRTFAHALVTVPNSVIANEALTNWSRMGKRRITFNLGVKYTTPAENLQRSLAKIRAMLQNHPEIDQETIFVHFNQFNDSSLGIFLYFFTKTIKWGEYLKVREDVNFKILEILKEEGVSLALPGRSIYLENAEQSAGRS